MAAERRDDEDDRAPRRVSASTLDARPSRSTTIAIGATVLVALAFVVAKAPRRAHPDSPASTPTMPAQTTVTPEEQLDQSMAELSSTPKPESSAAAKILELFQGIGPTNVGRKMPDGADPPPLPKDAPKVVRFGVVLVRYRGAQLAPELAPTREEALLRATSLVELAKSDFAAAVKQGDVGSVVDIGTVRRGILEPATEYVLFTLPKGWVSPVVDTPRGFWVMKRLR